MLRTIYAVARGLVPAALLVGLVGAVLLYRSLALPSSSAGSTGQASPEPTTASTSSSQPMAIGAGGRCSNVTMELDRTDPTVAGESRVSEAVVIGSVVSIGPARWGTKDGAAPAVSNRIPSPLGVYRVAKVRVVAAGRGNLGVDRILEVRVPGGTIGCSTFTIGGFADLVPGSQVAVFLGHLPSLVDADQADFDVTDAWPVSGETVGTPNEGNLPLSVFLDRSR